MRNRLALMAFASIIGFSLAFSGDAICQPKHGDMGKNFEDRPGMEKPHEDRYSNKSRADDQNDFRDHKKGSKDFEKRDSKNHDKKDKRRDKDFKQRDKSGKNFDKEKHENFRPNRDGNKQDFD